ncbi:essential meiotic endonuclease 1B [Rhynchospora pubera]|uniref:Essential meiotic endonuclease 1B n=1 Tax=Rhynchospora pubera TaxID=906938 RepID=A0AAV8D2Q0_9POAL|nr:essential meiotic endonuclease 1B [Rhynchospora pubera]
MWGGAAAVDILSESDGDASSESPPILVLDDDDDDDPTPTKTNNTTTSSDAVVVVSPSSLPRSSTNFAGIASSPMILLQSDDESETVAHKKSIASSPEIETLSDLDKDPCDDPLDDQLTTQISQDTNNEISSAQGVNTRKRKSASDRPDLKAQAAARKKQLKEVKAQLLEERKRKRQEEKLEREAKKAEEKELKKLEKENKKWEKGKLALKSIVAEIDSKVVQGGKLGGYLLTMFAEKGFSYRIMRNPIEGSIIWKMNIPDEVTQHSSVGAEVPYVLVVYQAEEFCDLIRNNLIVDHVHKVRCQYPSFTICYATNNLMSYIKKREQSQYKNPSKSNGWRSPSVDEVISKLATHYSQVHSRQCIDEAELAEHIIGLISSLASCQFRKKLTWLSVNANGLIIPKDAVEKNLIKKNIWLKVLIAIPKVQPRHAIAIWKKYPTMRSLLNVYLDSARSVHEKEFLLKDLMMEGILGNGERRLGEVCSKRVYRILMAQSGSIKTDDVEDGADFFG